MLPEVVLTMHVCASLLAGGRPRADTDRKDWCSVPEDLCTAASCCLDDIANGTGTGTGGFSSLLLSLTAMAPTLPIKLVVFLRVLQLRLRLRAGILHLTMDGLLLLFVGLP